jgi:hypothetical protein
MAGNLADAPEAFMVEDGAAHSPAVAAVLES